MYPNELELKVKQASQAYYEGHPIMTDKQWDDLVVYLRAVKPESKILSAIGYGFNPYKMVGEKESHLYGKVTGIERKPRSIDDIPESFRHYNKYVLSQKLDGASIVVYFTKGRLTKALTRGNGDTGINRTDKLLKILEKELRLPEGFDFTGAIRGEICISNENWSIMQEKGFAGSNQRNTATGFLNRDDTNEGLDFLDVIFYKVVGFENNQSTYNALYQNVLNENLFDVQFLEKFIKKEYIVRYFEIDNEEYNKLSQDELKTTFANFNNNYPCDGIVMTGISRNIEDIPVQYNVNRQHVIHDEIAYKFVTESAVTTIKSILWKMSKGNKAIPKINVEPVELSGAIVENAAAYNARYIYDNELDTGAEVELIRSGEVIPYISGIIKGVSTARSKIDNMTCPYCGNKLQWEGLDLVCKNEECSNRDYQALRIWTNTLAQVDGMSETLIFKFYEELGIGNLDTLYSKTYNDFAFQNVTDNSHKGKFNKVLDKLLNNDPIEFADLLVALNIKQLGKKNAEKLARHKEFPAIFQEFLDTRDPNLFISECHKKCEDAAGPSLIDNICSMDGLEKLLNSTFVKDRIIYVTYEPPVNLIPVVITGKLSVPRKDFEEYLAQHGYEVKGSVNKSTKYLITDDPDSASGKNKKATELGIEKITEAQIRAIIDDEENKINSSFIL